MLRDDQLPSDGIVLWGADTTGGAGYWNDGANFANEGVPAHRHWDGACAARIDGGTQAISQNTWDKMVKSPDKNRLWYSLSTADGHP